MVQVRALHGLSNDSSTVTPVIVQRVSSFTASLSQNLLGPDREDTPPIRFLDLALLKSHLGNLNKRFNSDFAGTMWDVACYGCCFCCTIAQEAHNVDVASGVEVEVGSLSLAVIGEPVRGV